MNNIILVGENNFRFVKLETSSKGELIFATSSCPSSTSRIYFGIDLNGEPIFKDSNGKNTYIIKKTICRSSTIERYETQSGIIKINGNGDNNKEYFINFGKSKTYTEIFDISDYYNNLIEKEYTDTGEINIKSYYGSFFNIYESSKNYYIMSTINSNNNFLMVKFNFQYESNGNIECTKVKEASFSAGDNRSSSCYLNNNMIVCAYLADNSKFRIMAFDTSFSNSKTKDLSITPQSSTSFHKLIYLKGDKGLFAYYKGISNDFPSIQIIEAKKSSTSYSITLGNTFQINNYYFNNSAMLNDFAKIREDLVGLASAETEREILMIILINFYNTDNYNIRYYSVDIFKLYNHKLMKDMAIHTYNNNIVLAFSFCPQSACNGDYDQHSSSLIFFSYPNTTDYNLDIIDYLSQKENNELEMNLTKNVNIDNNLFGYIVVGIKINNIDDCGIDLISNKTNESIENNDILSSNEKLEIVLKEDQYEIITCTLSFNLIITEPDYEVYNSYPISKLNEYDENEKSNFVKNKYEGKIGYFKILFNQEITKKCSPENTSCELCLLNDKSFCLICKGDFNYVDGSKICLQNYIPTTIAEYSKTIENTELIDKFSESTKYNEPTKSNNEIKITDISEIKPNIIKINTTNCSFEEIVSAKCPDIIISNEELKEIYYYAKKEILNRNYNNNNILIPTANVLFQISKLEEQKQPNSYISSVDLKECENILRAIYHINNEDFLIIYKIEIKNEAFLTSYVQYEIYESHDLQRLDLSVCNTTDIIINIPYNMDQETLSLYESLNEYGYNLFDSQDPFYNDFCTPYTSFNNADMTLNDRKNILYMYNGNKTICQTKCSIESYNASYNNAVCQCSVQTEYKIPDLQYAISSFNIDTVKDSFFKAIKNSNFLVLKCYKLVFNIKNVSRNIGLIIMTIIFIISLFLIIIYIFREQKKINIFIEEIIKIKFFSNNLKAENSDFIKSIKIKAIKKKLKNNSKIKKEQKGKLKMYIYKSNRNLNNINIIKKNSEPQKKYKLTAPNTTYSKNEKIKKDKYLSDFSNQSSHTIIKKDLNQELKAKKFNNIAKQNILTEHELNSLSYKLAIEIDKRTFFQYYWSLLKKKNLILFTFLPAKDYNLITIKLSLFLISISLYFTMNGFFFNDETMHKIYEDNGAFNLIDQIAQILYSTVIMIVINTILKLLSLSERKILDIKKIKVMSKAIQESKVINRCIKIQFIIFFILSTLLLFFSWYFISCFCIVYNNTQTILITDTLISLGLSMIYPFGLSFLPGIFRIPALRAKNKDKLILYQISLLIALI